MKQDGRGDHEDVPEEGAVHTCPLTHHGGARTSDSVNPPTKSVNRPPREFSVCLSRRPVCADVSRRKPILRHLLQSVAKTSAQTQIQPQGINSTDSSASAPNSSIVARLFRKQSKMVSVLQLPKRSQITFGGWPCITLKS